MHTHTHTQSESDKERERERERENIAAASETSYKTEIVLHIHSHGTMLAAVIMAVYCLPIALKWTPWFCRSRQLNPLGNGPRLDSRDSRCPRAYPQA